MDMGRIDDTYLLLLECSLVHRDGLGFIFGMIKCDFSPAVSEFRSCIQNTVTDSLSCWDVTSTLLALRVSRYREC
jgi:hypothetical protein